MRYDRAGIEHRIRKQCLPPSLRGSSPKFEIIEIIPRLKDGGAFVKFLAENPAEIESRVSNFLKSRRFKPWFSPFTRVKSFLVHGKPWLEDLYRFPSTRLKVEFISSEGKALSQEALYSLFRKYGRIADIVPQDPAPKDVPRFAILQFLRIRSATAARNCLHGFAVTELPSVAGSEGGVTLRISYESTRKVWWVWDWLLKHPRIVLPILAVLLTTFTVAVFDPIRTWFIQAKITRSLDLSENPYFRWLKSHTVSAFSFGKKPNDGDQDMSALWDERRGSIEQLQTWLLETEETFIVVQGPRGAGKKELVIDSVLKDRKNVLLIDCEPINEAHGDTAIIAAAAAQVGYRPVFSWMNTLSSLADLAAQGTIGTSAGLSQTLENQFNKILQNTGVALKRIALSTKGDKDPKEDDLSDEDYIALHPEVRPVVVIDNFLHTEGSSIIYSKLADWAALLVSSNTAHVIFLTPDITFSKSLARSLPDRVFRTVFLADALPDSAKRYVLKHLGSEDEANLLASPAWLKELDDSITALGGRLTDLEFLARRIKTGESPREAVSEIILSSAAEILKLYLLAPDKWTAQQAWFLVRALADRDLLRYNEIAIHDLFKDKPDDVVQALEQAEMISVVNRDGRPYALKPGKPVYRPAFRKLVSDRVLASKMGYEEARALVKIETEAIHKAENELATLAAFEGKKVSARVDYLTNRIGKAQKKIDAAEKIMAELKKVLVEEF